MPQRQVHGALHKAAEFAEKNKFDADGIPGRSFIQRKVYKTMTALSMLRVQDAMARETETLISSDDTDFLGKKYLGRLLAFFGLKRGAS